MKAGTYRDRLDEPRLLPHEIALGVALAGASGAAVLAHTFGPVPMSFTAPFVVMPTASVLVILALLRTRRYQRLHLFAGRLLMGGAWGLAATLAYDAIRPLLKLIFGFTFDPFRAMPIFGQLITGLPATDPASLAAGWAYHFWNGISFGMMFALVRPRGGPIAGFVWAMILQGLMMAAYPTFLQARLDDPGFLATGIVGHGLWGIVLGAGLRKGGRYA
ncbi:MAG: hypothetical protein HY675_10015 [Chloroflexi bacterium]|nr:hypothetical protein [Chloroflexota bacterium]